MTVLYNLKIEQLVPLIPSTNFLKMNKRITTYFDNAKATILPTTTPPYSISTIKQELNLQQFSSFFFLQQQHGQQQQQQ